MALNSAPASPSGSYIHVCVYLSTDPASTSAVDTAARLAKEQNAVFTAIYVETPYYRSLQEEERTALHDTILYAIQAGAKVEILSGTDSIYLIREYCRSHRVAQLVLTRPVKRTIKNIFVRPLATELLNTLPDVHLITVPGIASPPVYHFSSKKMSVQEVLQQISMTLVIMVIATIAAYFVDSTGADESVLAPIYMLAAMLCSIKANRIIWPIYSSVLAIFIFNFLFATPRYSLAYNQKELAIVYFLTFVTSLVASLLGMRLHMESQQARHSSWRTQTLLDTTHILQETENTDEIIPKIASKISKSLNRNLLYFPYENGRFGEELAFPVNPLHVTTDTHAAIEVNARNRCVEIKDVTGSHTQYFGEANSLYLPWLVSKEPIGVVAIETTDRSIGSYEYMIIDSILQECSVALEAKKRAEEIEQIRRQAESDQLRSNILKGISHDLRTPLTSIIGNIATAQESRDYLSREDLLGLLSSLGQDAQILSSMVENLLCAARLDSKKMPVNMQFELLSDIVEASLSTPGLSLENHPLEVELGDDLIFVQADHALISQVISNILMNAILHTPDGTPILLKTYIEGDHAVMEVIDEGGGIPDEEKSKIFNLFYTGGQTTDSDHYLGLGLFLCKTIIDAHEGTISVTDNTPHGCIFSFTLPLASFDMDDMAA